MASNREQFFQPDRQLATANAGGVIDGIRDGGGGADIAEFADVITLMTYLITLGGLPTLSPEAWRRSCC
ncbi:MAG TPA: hypothetical protein VFW22_10770 [Pseudolabrys sp.]|nr:hypothetical protein [Pseudolabrys sp.]